MLLVGVVARTHGNKGEVIVNPTTDFPDDRFAVGATVWGRAVNGDTAQPLRIGTARLLQGRPVVRFDGVATMSDAEQLAGWHLRVPAAARQILPAHVYYHHDLIGCEVVTNDGEIVGRVTAVNGEGHAVRLVISAARGEVLVPLAQDVCAVDVVGRCIVVTPPEGLLDVNGTWRA